jgi:hypothetical protein
MADSTWAQEAKSPRSKGNAEEKEASLEFPAYVFLVDLSGSHAYLELIKTALQASLNVLNPSAWVGLATYSSQFGLYDLRSEVPHVRYCRIPATSSGGMLPLKNMLPLEDFLVRVGPFKVTKQTLHCKILDYV